MSRLDLPLDAHTGIQLCVVVQVVTVRHLRPVRMNFTKSRYPSHGCLNTNMDTDRIYRKRNILKSFSHTLPLFSSAVSLILTKFGLICSIHNSMKSREGVTTRVIIHGDTRKPNSEGTTDNQTTHSASTHNETIFGPISPSEK